jgi:Recombination endonuclease VII
MEVPMPDLAVDGTPLWGDPPYQTTMDRDLRRLYGMRLDHYELLLARQGGVCAICGKPPLEGKRLVVDENHQTRLIRGLLCARCNRLTTEAREAYLADPPAAELGWYVPAKQWDVRQARNAGRARRHQEAREAAKREGQADQATAGPPSGLDNIRAMTRVGADHQADYDRALADSAAWTGGPVQVVTEPPAQRQEAPTRRRGLLGRLFG